MSHLLQVHRWNFQATQRGALPLMMEFQVNPDTAPFLVSSSVAVLWVPQAHPGGIIKAAVRADLTTGPPLGRFFLEVVDAITLMGQEVEWGNVHPFTAEGVEAAVEHVASYLSGDDLCLLANPRSELPMKNLAKEHRCLHQPCSWLPEDCAVVIPKDREYVGFLGLVGNKGGVAVIHNAARGVGVARGPVL